MHVLHDQVFNVLMQNGSDPSIYWQLYISVGKRPIKRDVSNLEPLEIQKNPGLKLYTWSYHRVCSQRLVFSEFRNLASVHRYSPLTELAVLNLRKRKLYRVISWCLSTESPGGVSFNNYSRNKFTPKHWKIAPKKPFRGYFSMFVAVYSTSFAPSTLGSESTRGAR